ncbi:dipeptide epimerase [Aureibaculum sp. 2210JD6-5]|uniref:mandelate racemase/muconate lactonizing enzyme family protein n=1 Tax=Aureibaculum sp. 2210JD6-5 TaxID=3103957 RepID=UPI002AAE82B0|nr:dipeptide epimerase [Aureibaculum sp. 2210JD6-5]MDY7395915.1 dipeptide epimerase [Aureibaculum sp. 2210JD6-5]
MNIQKISYQRFDIKLSEPYTIAYETISHATNFILKIETDSTLVGYGCAAPDKVVTNETPEQVETTIKDIIIPFLKGKNPFNYAKILADLKVLLKEKSSSLAMVDLAMHDLIAKKADVPLYLLLGGYRNSIATSITIGILPMEETLKKATDFVKQGFSIIKIKGGLNINEDIEKMMRLHELFPKVKWRFDGNQGYSVEEAIKFVSATKNIGIEIFEQPSKVGSDELLGEITEKVGLPVMADESLKTLRDVFRLAQNERIDMVNIKLQKVGGILEGLHINSVAKSAKLEAMVGCIDECSLGISAGLHFALSRPNIHYADLDGHLDMIDDPCKGMFQLKKGVLYPSKYPGLGKLKL